MLNSNLLLVSDFFFGGSKDILNVACMRPAVWIAHTPELTCMRSRTTMTKEVSLLAASESVAYQ